MSLDDDEHIIYRLAVECDDRFNLAASALPDDKALIHRPLREYHRRFEIWCSYLGVLAQPDFSLDRRVQFHDEIRHAILELLSLISRNLRGKICELHCVRHLCSSIVGNWTEENAEPNEAVSSFVEGTLVRGDSAMLSELGPIAKATLGAIGNALDRLQDLAKAIRRTSSCELSERVESYRAKISDDDEDLEGFAFERVKELFPNIVDSLAKQLAGSIAFRTLRLRYQQRHHRKLSKRRPVVPRLLHSHGHDRAHVIPESITSLGKPKEPQSAAGVSENLSTTDHSHLSTRRFHRNLAEVRSTTSGPSIVSLRGTNYAYPRQPRPDFGNETCECAWCFEELKNSQLEIGGWWRSVISSHDVVFANTDY